MRDLYNPSRVALFSRRNPSTSRTKLWSARYLQTGNWDRYNFAEFRFQCCRWRSKDDLYATFICDNRTCQNYVAFKLLYFYSSSWMNTCRKMSNNTCVPTHIWCIIFERNLTSILNKHDFLQRFSIFKTLKFLISFRIFIFVCVSIKGTSVILLWNIIQLKHNVNGGDGPFNYMLQNSVKNPPKVTFLSLSRYVIKMIEMLSIVVFKSLVKYQMDGREYLWQRSFCRGAGQECPLDYSGGKGDVVRLRETIVRTLRKRTRCGEARGIKANSHAHARVFVCVMMRKRRKRINGSNAGITQSRRRSELNRSWMMNCD